MANTRPAPCRGRAGARRRRGDSHRSEPDVHIFSKGPAMVAGLMAIPETMRAEGVPPCWSGYVGVEDVDADAKRVIAAGGAIQRPPTDIPSVGRFAVVSDPGGAVFLLFKPNTEEGPKSVAPMTPGHIGWHELM